MILTVTGGVEEPREIPTIYSQETLVHILGARAEALEAPRAVPNELVETLSEAQNAPVSEETEKVGSIFYSCIKTARWLGVDLPPGDAKDLVPNSKPVVGGAILLRYGDVYHVAVIKGFAPEGFYVAEGNYKRGTYTERVIPFDDKSIRGFWSQ